MVICYNVYYYAALGSYSLLFEFLCHFPGLYNINISAVYMHQWSWKMVSLDLQCNYIGITHVVDMLRGSTVLLGDYNMSPCYMSWLYRHVYDMYWVLWLLTGLMFHDLWSLCWGFLAVIVVNDHILLHIVLDQADINGAHLFDCEYTRCIYICTSQSW